jgi:hypothetical protein
MPIAECREPLRIDAPRRRGEHRGQAGLNAFSVNINLREICVSVAMIGQQDEVHSQQFAVSARGRFR